MSSTYTARHPVQIDKWPQEPLHISVTRTAAPGHRLNTGHATTPDTTTTIGAAGASRPDDAIWQARAMPPTTAVAHHTEIAWGTVNAGASGPTTIHHTAEPNAWNARAVTHLPATTCASDTGSVRSHW